MLALDVFAANSLYQILSEIISPCFFCCLFCSVKFCHWSIKNATNS